MDDTTPNFSQNIFVNRELSWLEFNRRVLSESLNPNIPLMERLKFLSIYFSNLDEFFMVRVGSLHDQSILEPDKLDDKTGLNAAGQIDAILRRVNEISSTTQRAWDQICQEFKSQNIDILDIHHMSKLDEQILQKYFSQEMRPLLSPQIIDRQHPFPFLKTRSLLSSLPCLTKRTISDWALSPSHSCRLTISSPSTSAARYCSQQMYFCTLPRNCLANRRYWKSILCGLREMQISRWMRVCLILTSIFAV